MDFISKILLKVALVVLCAAFYYFLPLSVTSDQANSIINGYTKAIASDFKTKSQTLAMARTGCHNLPSTTCDRKSANSIKIAATKKKTVKSITLLGAGGKNLKIGEIIFTPVAEGTHFKVNMDGSLFSDHFLSMRPFKCIDGIQTVCHLIYPYKTKDIITKDNLMDLEYAFLFIHKAQAEYGINFWNGVYYRMKYQADGSIKGVVWETDMNELAVPPKTDYERPIGGEDLVEGDRGKHRYPEIEIK